MLHPEPCESGSKSSAQQLCSVLSGDMAWWVTFNPAIEIRTCQLPEQDLDDLGRMLVRVQI